MLNAKLFTRFLKHVADELGAIIASDDRAAVYFKKILALYQKNSEKVGGPVF